MDSQQRKALELAKEGHNLVILGQAGTGKTFLVREICKQLHLLSRKVGITATTGIAASHLEDGSTVHRWAGLEDGRHSIGELIRLHDTDERFIEAKERIKSADALIIDEISMLSSHIFAKLEILCRTIRSSPFYFGGLQIILSGDIFQLPPIAHELYGDTGDYFFRCSFFDEFFPHIIKLEEVHRQHDLAFITAINELERGDNVSIDTMDFIKSLSRVIDNEEDAIHLFATNLYADIFNHTRLTSMPGQTFFFKSEDEGEQHYLNKMLAPPTLAIKIGCKVMLLINLSSNLVNGLQGIVTGIMKESITVSFDIQGQSVSVPIGKHSFTTYDPVSRSILAERRQILLKLCYGITIHKSQGMTLNRAIVDCRGVNKPGQLGVAIGRAVDSQGLRLINMKKSCIKQHKQLVYAFDKHASFGIILQVLTCCRKERSDEQCEEHQDDDGDDKQSKNTSYEQEYFIDDDDDFCDIEDQALEIIEVTHTEKVTNTLLCVMDDYNNTPYEEDSKDFYRKIMSNKALYQEWFDVQNTKISRLLKSVIAGPSSKVEPKHFRQFYSEFHSYLNSDSYKISINEFYTKMKINVKDFHHQFLVSVMFNIQRSLIQALSEETEATPPPPFRRLPDEHEAVSGSGRGKIRYIGGFTIAKITHRESLAIRSVLYKQDKQDDIQEHILMLKLLEIFHATDDELESSSDKESLEETKRKQNIRGSLTNISDASFSFFSLLERKCRNFLTHINLVKFGEEIFQNLLRTISDEKEVSESFLSLFHELQIDETSEYTPSQEQSPSEVVSALIDDVLFLSYCIVTLKNMKCELFCRVCISQFRKDYLRFVKTEKQKALRKKVMQRTSHSVQKLDMTSIIKDESDGKVVSHFLLKSEINKDNLFLHGRTFTKANLLRLAICYELNLPMSTKKSDIASLLSEKITRSNNMPNSTELREDIQMELTHSVSSTGPSTSGQSDIGPSSGQSDIGPSTSGHSQSSITSSMESVQLPSSSTSTSQSTSVKKRGSKRKGKGKGSAKKKTVSKNPDEFCTKCNREYKEDQDWICCDICSSWFDRSCAGLDDDFLWNIYSEGDNEFTCPFCKQHKRSWR